jgi:acetyltransferase-like isoleucine patch superfamily enzyme
MSFYTGKELESLGFASVGRNARISRDARFHGQARISIGDHSRIDDFCVLSAGRGGIAIGRHVHIAVMCSLIGQGRIEMMDFSALSSRVSVYSSSDDYSGAAMTNPTVPDEFRSVDSRPVRIGRHVIVGAGSVILPGTDLLEGAALGALSLASGTLGEFAIYSGTPARRIGLRRRDLLELAERMKRGEAEGDAPE